MIFSSGSTCKERCHLEGMRSASTKSRETEPKNLPFGRLGWVVSMMDVSGLGKLVWVQTFLKKVSLGLTLDLQLGKGV